MRIQTASPNDTIVPERPWKEIKTIKPPRWRFFFVSVFFTKKEKTSDNGVVTEYFERSKPRTYKKEKVEVIRNV